MLHYYFKSCEGSLCDLTHSPELSHLGLLGESKQLRGAPMRLRLPRVQPWLRGLCFGVGMIC